MYASNIDSIVISNTALEVECYNFSTLNALASDTKEKEAMKPEWTCNIGE